MSRCSRARSAAPLALCLGICIDSEIVLDFAHMPALTLNSKRSEVELPNMQNCCKRSELELRGPRIGLKIGPRSSRG
eukprot:4064512-Alexandrium_andersonii.AAC.1